MTTPAEAPSPASQFVEVRPLSGHTGAEILGVDLTDLTPEVIAQIRSALLRWKVVFFRDQHLTPEAHLEAGRAFGDVMRMHPLFPTQFTDHPEIMEARSGSPDPDAPRTEKSWHTDDSYALDPPMASILRDIELPLYGGDTQFTNLACAYEQLSPEIRELVDRLHAVHHNQIRMERGDHLPAYAQHFLSRDVRTVHPVVRVHPETGERIIFVNPLFSSHISELSRRESAHVLSLLFEHITSPEFTCRFRWEPGSVAFWDNRATCHRAPADVPEGMPRVMQRIALAGDVPVGVDGRPSYAVSTPVPGA